MSKYNLQFKPSNTNIKSFYSSHVDVNDDGYLVIPENQRPYSWVPNDQSEQLVIDLIEYSNAIFKKLPSTEVHDLFPTLKNSTEIDTYFFGTLVISTESGHHETIVRLVDGQQRMTSVIILLAAIRDLAHFYYYSNKDKSKDMLDLAQRIQKDYIGKKDGGKYSFYFRPSDDYKNKDNFKQYIQNSNFNQPYETIKAKGKNIIKATKAPALDEELKLGSKNDENNEFYKNIESYKIFYDYIESEIEIQTDKKLFSSYTNALWGYFYALTCKFELIILAIEDDYKAYEFFESINAKKLELQVADLIKNKIFTEVLKGITSKKSYDSKKETISEKWKKTIEYLNRSSLDSQEFLRYYWSSKHGYIPPKTLYKVITSEISENHKKLFKTNTLNDAWEKFLKNISKGSKHLSLLTTKEVTFNNFPHVDQYLKNNLNKYSNEKSKKWYRLIYNFRNLKNKTWIVLLLSFIRNIKKSEIDLYKHVDVFFKFSFIYFEILGLKPNNYFTLMFTYAKKFEDIVNKYSGKNQINELNWKFLNPFYEKMLSYINLVNREPFIAGLIENNYYSKSSSESRFKIRYIIDVYERNELSGNETYSFDQISIEHVIPQSPYTHWKISKGKLKVDHNIDYNNFLNQLGNLGIIEKDYNKDAGNYLLDNTMKSKKKYKTNEYKNYYYKKSRMENIKEILEYKYDFRSIVDNDFSVIEKRSRDISKSFYNNIIVKTISSMEKTKNSTKPPTPPAGT